MDGRVPVTLLSGYLGAGKTTVLNELLNSGEVGRCAVVVNEAGELGVDGFLIREANWGLVEIVDGCVCCTVLGDLSRALAGILQTAKEPLDRILIETSGLASPGPVVRTLGAVAELRERLRVSGVVTVLHAQYALDQLDRRSEAREQVACCDRLLMGHVDRVGEAELLELEACLRELRPDAPCKRSSFGQIDPAWILDEGQVPIPEGGEAVSHSEGVVTVSLSSEEPIDLHALKLWLKFLSARRAQQLLRIKGVFRCNEAEVAVAVHGIHDWLEFGPLECEPPSISRIVVVGDGLDVGEVRRGWEAVRAQAGRS